MIFWGIFALAGMMLCFSTFVAWYEGSNLVNDPFEWKYTAKVTHSIKGEITDYHQINQLDYFIYAAKFHPLFPILMLVSASIIIILIMYKSGILKRFIHIP
ncbi:YjdJ family protein [Neobacillus drentensis]|uniref:YjdJ family protein n=1 Tax=Neobacillus drentensis TaxID=220684 RepID=UPI002FFDAC06